MAMNLPVVADSLSIYLGEIRKFPVLTADEEHYYAVKLFEEKDLDAAHRLITSNLRFVVKIAAEYRTYGMKMIDLIQEGNIGLMVAVRKFDPHKGIRLISYAVWWIRAYIHNYIVSAWSLLKIGTTQAQKKLFFKLGQAKNTLLRLTGKDDVEATAQALNVKVSDVLEMDQRMKGDFSLDADLADGDGLTLLESLADDRPNQEEAFSRHEQELQLQQHVALSLEKLNEKERYIIENRVIADTPMTLQEIAEHFNITRERVRQIEGGALKKLKGELTTLAAGMV